MISGFWFQLHESHMVIYSGNPLTSLVLKLELVKRTDEALQGMTGERKNDSTGEIQIGHPIQTSAMFVLRNLF